MFRNILILFLLFSWSFPVWGMTLNDMLAQVYRENPKLLAEREGLKATDELVPQALSGYRPTVAATGAIGKVDAKTSGGFANVIDSNDVLTSKTAELTFSQPLFRGGQTVAAVDAAESAVKASRAGLIEAEQSVFYEAIEAYLNVYFSQSAVALHKQAEEIYAQKLKEAKARFNAGELTKTDVSQAEARLAAERAERIQAEGQLGTYIAQYRQIVGIAPGDLHLPPKPAYLPSSLLEAVEIAIVDSPQVLQAHFQQEAAESAIDQVTGELLPQISLDGTTGKAWERSFRDEESTTNSIFARVTIPLYEAGSVTARRREALKIASQRKYLMTQAKREAKSDVYQAWELVSATRSSLDAYEKSLDAAGIAAKGVALEEQAGERTWLDVLDAEQELLQSRVNLIEARKNNRLAEFNLLKAMGRLTARAMALPVDYFDPSAYYSNVRDKWWGLGE